MSEHAAAAGKGTHAPIEGTALASPEFDNKEVSGFGRDDGHAVTVIGKMLVGFFFYSLLVMMAVGGWTWWTSTHAPASHAADTHHADEDE